MCLTVEKDLTALAERPSSLLMYFSDSEDHIFLFSLHRISVNYPGPASSDPAPPAERRQSCFSKTRPGAIFRKPPVGAPTSGGRSGKLRLLPSSESQIVEKLSSARQSPPTHGHQD